MATPDADHTSSSHGDDAVDNEREMGQSSVGGDTKVSELIASWDKKAGTPFSRNRPIQNSDQETISEILHVSNASVSQLLDLPHNLQSLTIKGCQTLDVIPNNVFNELPFLKELRLIDCSSLRISPYPASLTILQIRECRKFQLLPTLESKQKLSSLDTLFIGSSCDSLTTLSLDLFPKLKALSMCDCPNLLAFNIARVNTGDLALVSLDIRDCLQFNSFPDEGFHTPNLHSIYLSNCKNLCEFPNFIKSLTSSPLSLYLLRCPRIESFPCGSLPSSLTFLSIGYCDKLTSQKDWGLKNLKSLTTFYIRGGCTDMKSFPEENLLPETIKTLCITDLKSLRKLDNKGFQQLNALRRLEINCCDVLQYFPEQGLPSTLDALYINKCPMLIPRLKPKTGEYWRMVADLEDIQIDNRRVSEPTYGY